MESLSRSRSSATAASSSCTRSASQPVALLDQAGDPRRRGRKWGLELVRNRADQRRLEAVRLAKRLGVRCILLETLTLDRRCGKVGDRREQAHVVIAGRSRLRRHRHEHALQARGGLQRQIDTVGDHTRNRVARPDGDESLVPRYLATRRHADGLAGSQHPAPRAPPRRKTAMPSPAEARQRPARPASTPAHVQRGPARAEYLGDLRHDELRRRIGGLLGGDAEGEPVEELEFAAAAAWPPAPAGAAGRSAGPRRARR